MKKKIFPTFLLILTFFYYLTSLPIVMANDIISEGNTEEKESDNENKNDNNTNDNINNENNTDNNENNEDTENNNNENTPSDDNNEDNKDDENTTTYIEYTARSISSTGLNVRKTPSSSSEIVAGLKHNETFKYKDSDIKKVENDSCPIWIYVSTKLGYVCKTYIEVTKEEEITIPSNENIFSSMTDEEFDVYLNEQGFDETYKNKLKSIHKIHPNWVFVGVETNRDWNSTVKEESQIGYSTYYINSLRVSAGHEAYLSTESHYDWTTDMFYGYDGWFFLANEQTVAYFLDPRNYLNEQNLFMYESLYFDETYQTKDKITTVLGTNQYSDYIYDAGKEFNYSSIAAAIKIRQEGTLGNRPTIGISEINCSGGLNAYYDPNGQKFLGPLYNFFNIGATSRPSDADLNGLCYAATTNSNYLLPWNTPEKAIKGGIKWIAGNYVSSGQYTNYFQKFNTANANTEIWHQYMTNLEDPKSQSQILYNLYNTYGLLNTPFVFYIPIYNNMPEETKLPTPGNPNNWLTSLSIKVDDVTTNVSNFKGDVTEYTINVENYVDSIVINSTAVAATSHISIDSNEKKLKTNSKQVALEEKESTFEIEVTAGNGDKKIYKLTIIKDDAPEDQPTIDEMLEQSTFKVTDEYLTGITFGMGTNTITEEFLKINKFATIKVTNNKDEVKTTGALGTGDKITITSKDEEKTFEIILYGDINGDGTVNNIDLLTVQKHIWKDTTLLGSKLKSADIDKDESITNADLLRIQKHIWKDLTISQD